MPNPSHISVVSRVNGRKYVTVPYVLHDTLRIGAGEFSGGLATPSRSPQPANTTIHEARGAPWALLDAADSSICAAVRAPHTWDAGTLVAIRVLYSASQATSAVTLNTSVSCEIGTSLTTTTDVDSTSVAPPSATTDLVTATADITLALDFDEGAVISVSIGRTVSDANTGVFYIWGCEIDFEADGPETAGDYAIPDRSN